MIQRIQSLWLLLATLSAALLFFLPLATFVNPEGGLMIFNILGVQNQGDTEFFGENFSIALLIINCVMTIFPLVIIFLFKKRELQVKLSQFTMLVAMAFLCVMFLYHIEEIQKVFPFQEPVYKAGMYCVIAEVIFLIFAIRGIKKDIALLRSIDRIR